MLSTDEEYFVVYPAEFLKRSSIIKEALEKGKQLVVYPETRILSIRIPEKIYAYWLEYDFKPNQSYLENSVLVTPENILEELKNHYDPEGHQVTVHEREIKSGVFTRSFASLKRPRIQFANYLIKIMG